MPVFLFSDIEGSVKKWELNPEVMARALTRYDEIFLSTVKEFGGKPLFFGGEGNFAVFDSREALECALTIQERVEKTAWGDAGVIQARVAVHAGEIGARELDQFGPISNRTACIMVSSWGGQIVLTPEALVWSDLPKGSKTIPLGTHLLKDLMEPQVLLGLSHPLLSRQDFPPLKTLSTKPNNLPTQRTLFFGRETELKKIKRALEEPSCRLLTLLGPGGIGKTRVVIQAAAEQLIDFTDGVHFVSLAPINSPDAVISAVASAVHFSFSGEADMAKELLGFFKDRKILLVLDNFEHLLPAAAFVDQLLSSAPRVKVLVSSRIRLDLPHEKLLELEGLEYPEEGNQRSAESFSAFNFFVNCVQRVRKDLSIKEDEVKEVVRICQLVGGAPLGLELAAVWVQILSFREIRAEIEKNIDFLASNRQDVPERQRSLRAVFEYSWDQLKEEDKRGVRALSVFRGEFTMEQAEKVAKAHSVLLSALVEKSLLHRSRTGRFELHELLRQFFAAKLKEEPQEDEAAHHRHMDFFLFFLIQRHSKLRSKDESQALEEIGAEYNNIQSAWEWAVQTKNGETIGAASDPLYHYYEIRFLAHEGEKIFCAASEALENLERESDPRKALPLARVVARWGWFCYQRGRMEQAELLMKKGLELARKAGALQDVGEILHFLCALYRATGDFDQNEECALESLRIFKELKQDWGIAWSLYHLVPKARHEGNYELACEYCAESLEVFDKMGYEDGAAWALFGLGQVSVLQKRFDDAKKYFKQSLKIFERHENNVAAGWVLIDLVRMHTSLEENETSFVLAKKAYEAFKPANHSLGLGWSQYYRSESAYHVREYEEALRAGQEAIVQLDETGGQSGQAWVCVNLCRTANALGRYDEGRNFGKKGIELFLLSVGDAEGANGCRIHLARSETGLRNFHVAEELLMQALDRLVDMKIYWRVLEGILIFAKLRAAEGKTMEAYRFFSLVEQHPESQKEAKLEAMKAGGELVQDIGQSDAQKIIESTRSVDLPSFIKQMVAEYQADAT